MTPIQLLATLCEVEPSEILGQQLDELPDGPIYRQLIHLTALAHVGNAGSVFCFACQEPHPVPVEYAGQGRYRIYCPEAGYQDVDPNRLKRYIVDESWIIRAIGSPLGLREQPCDRDAVAVWIGRAQFGRYPCHLFFGQRLFDKARFLAACQLMTSRMGKAPGVLVTTTSTALIPGALPPRSAPLELESILRLEDGRVSLDDEPFHSLLSGRPAHPGDMIGYTFSPGFRTAVVGDESYNFSDKQALVVEALFEARRSGTGRLHQTELQGLADTNQKMGQLFRNHPAYGNLIKHDAGYYRLDL